MELHIKLYGVTNQHQIIDLVVTESAFVVGCGTKIETEIVGKNAGTGHRFIYHRTYFQYMWQNDDASLDQENVFICRGEAVACALQNIDNDLEVIRKQTEELRTRRRELMS